MRCYGPIKFIVSDSMKKSLIYILGLFAINVAVTFAAALAFMLFLFRDDPLLAAVPAVLAAPAILLQPWFVAFALIPVKGFLLTPFLTTLVTFFVYRSLNESGLLDGPKAFLSRLKNRKTFAMVSGFVLLAVAVMVARQVDFPALHRGLPPSVHAAGLNVTDSRYYCLGSFIDSEWLWQARVQESDLASLANKFGLQPVDSNQVPDVFRRK